MFYAISALKRMWKKMQSKIFFTVQTIWKHHSSAAMNWWSEQNACKNTKMVIYKKKSKGSLLTFFIVDRNIEVFSLWKSFVCQLLFQMVIIFKHDFWKEREKKKIVNAENKLHCYGEKTFVLKSSYMWVGVCWYIIRNHMDAYIKF